MYYTLSGSQHGRAITWWLQEQTLVLYEPRSGTSGGQYTLSLNNQGQDCTVLAHKMHHAQLEQLALVRALAPVQSASGLGAKYSVLSHASHCTGEQKYFDWCSQVLHVAYILLHNSKCRFCFLSNCSAHVPRGMQHTHLFKQALLVYHHGSELVCIY